MTTRGGRLTFGFVVVGKGRLAVVLRDGGSLPLLLLDGGGRGGARPAAPAGILLLPPRALGGGGGPLPDIVGFQER